MNTSEFIEFLKKNIPTADQYAVPNGSYIIQFELKDGALVTIEIT